VPAFAATSRTIERRYLILIEHAGDTNLWAYAPGLPGVVATGASVEECEPQWMWSQ
jgi:predicted RNase H-like HicB family nuclease